MGMVTGGAGAARERRGRRDRHRSQTFSQAGAVRGDGRRWKIDEAEEPRGQEGGLRVGRAGRWCLHLHLHNRTVNVGGGNGGRVLDAVGSCCSVRLFVWAQIHSTYAFGWLI